ncbi:hypothetical protein [Labrenzia sp. OB1]|uniref:hypothetical protein n=1 Tax=Labrenzia sp. OB1 TaxID=1561204 RepID=UPI0007B18E86|nr:hypothetical protein [Labrenzia sp. OB1]KZM47597.1 hypothetical protein OA90_24880 [Labrenzia sp. OB1]
MQKTHNRVMSPSRSFWTKAAMGAGLVFLCTASASAQNNQLRVLPQSGSPRLPSAEQQLNGTLDRQESGFSTGQRIDNSNRLNRTQDINRQNMRPNVNSAPCAGSNATCREGQ